MTVYFLGSSGRPVAGTQKALMTGQIDGQVGGDVHGMYYDLGAKFSLQLVRRDA